MTRQGPDAGERQVRLEWMRAEFRDAQRRRARTGGAAAVTTVSVAEPESRPEAEPPTRATPPR